MNNLGDNEKAIGRAESLFFGLLVEFSQNLEVGHPLSAELFVFLLVDVVASEEAADVVAARLSHRQLALGDHQVHRIIHFLQGQVDHLLPARRFVYG